MPRVNLLVADDVGLGKTIETGMVLLELILRHRARRILVVVPASLQIKWQSEMRDKFGLEFRIVDSRLMHDLRRTRGLHANPWTHFPRLITSIDFLKREHPLRLFREALPAAGQSPYPRRFDVLLVDEAHNVAPAGHGQYALDSLRTSAVRMLAPHFEHKLFLTATPHNGYPESFTALLELLDPQRFARTVKLDQQQLQVVMVRRLKSEITGWDGKKRFAERKPPLPLVVRYTLEEKEVHAALQEYGRLRMARIHDTAGQCATEFILKLLKKRLFSSPRAFADTLARHEESLRSARSQAGAVRPSPRFLQQEFDRVDEDHENEEELETATAEALHAAAQAVPELETRERELLATVRAWAQRACGSLDSKTICLIQWLDEMIRPNGRSFLKLFVSHPTSRIMPHHSSAMITHFTPHRTVGLAAHPAVVPGELMSVLVRRAHPALMYSASAYPIRLPVEPAAGTAGITDCRVGLKFDCLVATTDDQGLGFDRLAGLQVLVPGVNHHLAGFAVGHDFSFRLAIQRHHIASVRPCLGL